VNTHASIRIPTSRPTFTVHSARPGRPAGRIHAFLLDAECQQSLAMIRSFGRSGLTVGAVVCASEERHAAALRSRWCSLTAVLPDFSSDPRSFADALVALLADYPADMIVPCHDGSISALRTRRRELERHTAVPLASEAALDIAVSKARTLELAKCLGIPAPRTIVVVAPEDVEAALNQVGYPAVIKPVMSWAERHGVGRRLLTECVTTLEQAQRRVDTIRRAGGQALFQEWLSGAREAVTLFYSGGTFWARFAQRSYRERPAIGGGSALCESIPLLMDLLEPAERLVRGMDVEGCSMVEFRRDKKDRPVLMEVNARIAGSVALAQQAGVDFPALLRDWALGVALKETRTYRVGVRRRFLAADVANLRTAIKGGVPDVPSRGRALATFITDFVRRPSTLDFFDAGDLKPALIGLREIARTAFRRPADPSTGPADTTSTVSPEPEHEIVAQSP
jgi:predicted ATP-grasp superfamily ATP-dependent carboligase